MEYVITGIRDGETTFTAPVEADSAEGAEEECLDSVQNPDEFEIEDVEPSEDR